MVWVCTHMCVCVQCVYLEDVRTEASQLSKKKTDEKILNMEKFPLLESQNTQKQIYRPTLPQQSSEKTSLEC